MSDLWPSVALAGLGAYHGINPGMGWLFAVALGLQEQSRQAVLRALIPLALGHALSMAIVALAVIVAQANLEQNVLRYSIAAILFGFGFYRLVRHKHPRWGGMRVGFRDLGVWSFLMASAHGAGLMIVPIFLKQADHLHHHGDHSMHHMSSPISSSASMWLYSMGIGIHTLSYFLVMGAIAVIVYEKLGLALLRKAWVNLDLLWVIALMVTGVVTLFVGGH